MLAAALSYQLPSTDDSGSSGAPASVERSTRSAHTRPEHAGSVTIAATQKMLANVLERRRDAGEVSEDADLGIAAHDILTPVIMYFLLHHASPHWKTEAAQFIDNHCTLWQRALAP